MVTNTYSWKLLWLLECQEHFEDKNWPVKQLVMYNLWNILSKYKYHVPKTNVPRQFFVTAGDLPVVNMVNLIKKYFSHRPKSICNDRFFLNYKNGKFIKQAVGINKLGSLSKQIAIILKLQNPEQYTGHCFRRSSTSLLEYTGADFPTINHMEVGSQVMKQLGMYWKIRSTIYTVYNIQYINT